MYDYDVVECEVLERQQGYQNKIDEEDGTDYQACQEKIPRDQKHHKKDGNDRART